MDLKNTKATAVSFTAVASVSSGQPSCTEEASGASKSSYLLGLAAEQRAEDYFQKKGLQLRYRRWKTPFAEVDLVFQGPRHQDLLLVEVKRRSNLIFQKPLLSQRQIRRLRRAAHWLIEAGWRVRLAFVLVLPDDSVIEIPEVFVDPSRSIMNP